MSHPKVIFYMHDLSGGGVERMRLSLIAELRARGLRVSLVVGRRSGSLAHSVPDDLDVAELGCKGVIASVMPLARLLRRVRPDVLVASLDHNNITAMLAGLVSGTDTRIVICQHNALSAEISLGWKYRLVPWFYWLLQRNAHGIVAVSRGVAKDLSKIAGIARTRITTIYNPVMGSDFRARVLTAPPHPWFCDGGAPVLIFVGRLTQQKDPALLLTAMARLSRLRRVRLILIGEGPLRAALEAQAEDLGISDLLYFAGFQADPIPWIASAVCLVSTSRYEGLGNVLVEALACGTPVIATDCPHGPSEVLLDGHLGHLVPVGDARKLAYAIAHTLQVTPDRATLRARALSFTAAACADAHLDLFERLWASENAVACAFGLNLSALSAEQVVERVMMAPEKTGPSLLVTPNIDHVRLLRNELFARAYRWAHLVCPDGFPVLAYARARGLALGCRVTGCDIYSLLVAHPMLSHKVIFIVADSVGTQSSVRRWAAGLGLSGVAVAVAPPALLHDHEGQAALAREIAEASPDILVMTLGAPTSETFVYNHRQLLPACWALCLGQAVKAHLGLVPRAPAAWQRRGFEWAWRIRQEPRRLAGRYLLAVVWFPIAVLKDLLASPVAVRDRE